MFLFIFCSVLLPSFAQEIRQAPESTVVFLNQSAVFTCETIGGTPSWVVNRTQREVIDPEIIRDLMISEETIIDGGSTVQDLTIPARAEYNGTRVQCLVFSLSGSDQSENATMIIQGPPSSVSSPQIFKSATSITISWEAPWSLDVTGVDHDIWYSVLIQNVTDENNPTPINCTDCTNITETVYTFTPDHLTPCHVYNFSVTPFNGAGQGESTDNANTKTSCLTITDIKTVCDDITITFQTLGVYGYTLHGISSPLLKSANISRSDSTIIVDCQFTETHPKASCVLVYREYDSPLLTVIDIPSFLDFPVSVTVEYPENYTFALFGKDSVLGMDKEPVVCIKFSLPVTDMNADEGSEREETNSSQTQVVVISISMTLVVCALACGAAVLGLLVFRRYCRQKRAGPNGRNVVYDEVVLPPTSSSSSSSTVIPTEPNAAYATTTRVARHHHSS